MKIFVNGEEREFPGVTSVRELIDRLEIPPQTALVEHNGEALRKSEWSSRAVAEGDRFEVIRIVAGG